MSADWISASAARAMGSSGTEFTDAIIEHARVGLVKTRARLLVWDREGQKIEQHDCDVPKDFWHYGVDAENWNQGNFEVLWNRSSTSWMAPGATDSFAYDVTFSRADIEAMVPASGTVTVSSRSQVSENHPKGGAPGKYDWARAVGSIVFLWADNGAWQPTSQGEVRAKLTEWFSDQGQAPDDKSLKQYARWLFDEFQKRKTPAE